MTDIVAITSTIWAGQASALRRCPKSVTVTLKGQTGMFNSWATEDILRESPDIVKNSDGYQITVAISMVNHDTVNGEQVGGCIYVPQGGVICIKTNVAVANGIVGSLSAFWIPAKTYKAYSEGLTIAGTPWTYKMATAAAITGYKTNAQPFLPVTEISKRDWGITYSPDCQDVANPHADCAVARWVAASTMTYGATWFQPREQKYYGAGLHRITKRMTASFYALVPATGILQGFDGGLTIPCVETGLDAAGDVDATATPTSLNNKGFMLTGASALVYGASIAFGATAMAFI